MLVEGDVKLDIGHVRQLFPKLCENSTRKVSFESDANGMSNAPLRVGVMLSGGQAAGT